MILEFAEDKEFLHAESATYTRVSLLSDIGGAAGLFLGLSVVGIIEKCGWIGQQFWKGTRKSLTAKSVHS